MQRCVILLTIILWTISAAMAQSVNMPTPKTKSATTLEEQTSAANYDASLRNVYIRYQHDKAWPRWDYANNLEARKTLVKVVKALSSDKNTRRCIIIEGAASPIGSDSYNQALALRRAAVLKNIISKLEGGDKLQIHIVSAGEDWITFSQYIKKEYHRSNRNEVIAILEEEG